MRDPEILSNINVILEHEDVKQKVWKRVYKSNSIVQSIKKGIALDFGLEIIAGGKTSFLYKNLVEEKKLFSSVGGYYQGFTKGPATIYFYAIPIKDLSEYQINIEIDTTLQDAIKVGISDEEFDRKKKKYFYNSIYQRDSIAQPAQILGEALSIGLSIDEVLNWDRYIESLTVDDVMNELKVFIKNRDFVTGMLK